MFLHDILIHDDKPHLTLITAGFLGVRFGVGGGGGVGGGACLKLVRIMLEIWDLVRKYVHMCSFRKYTFY